MTVARGAETRSAVAGIGEALESLRRGRPVLVLDAQERENEGDVVLAAQGLSPEWMAWTVRHTSGVVCVALSPERADHLALPPMVVHNEDPKCTAFTVSVDARTGVSTGISAADRAHTVRLLADPATEREQLTRPGHVFPLRARPGGVLERPGHTEAAVDLCRLAGVEPVGVLAELVHDDGPMMRLPDVLALGETYDLPVITIEDLVAYRVRHDRVRRLAETRIPTHHGVFTATGYRDALTGDEHLLLLSPRGWGGATPLVRVHSECLTGEAFGSRRCDCGPQLQLSLSQVARKGGAIVYLRGHEGRGVGLVDKLRAYALQDTGVDTVDAQTRLGLPVDARDYTAAAGMLHDQGVTRVELLTNNPDKVAALQRNGITVAAVTGLGTTATTDNERYLRSKRDRLHHRLVLPATGSQEGA